MDRFLVVIGCQEEKLEKVNKRFRRDILDFINSNAHKYTGVISIVRRDMRGSRNFNKSGDNLVTNNMVLLGYPSDDIIEVPGYVVDASKFRTDASYDLIGISTSASVLGVAMSMYSQGLDITVLKDYCEDRKGKKLGDMAFSIMEAYMPGCLK